MEKLIAHNFGIMLSKDSLTKKFIVTYQDKYGYLVTLSFQDYWQAYRRYSNLIAKKRQLDLF